MNEVVASSLCERLGVAHVPYDVETDGVAWESACPCMTDDNTELVSAWHVVCGCNRRGDESRAAWYKRACANHGLDVSREVEQMLVVDYIICNWDRHWSNFGVLVNSETREWLRPAPLFDMGESLWCDRTPAQGLGGYVASREGAPRPFLHRLDDQLGRYCHDLSWLDPSALEGFGEEVTERLLQLKFVAVFEGRAEAIGEAVDKRIQRVLHTLSYLHR